MNGPALTEQDIKDFVIRWSIEYFEVARADQRYIRVDECSKINKEAIRISSSPCNEWELRVWYSEDNYAYVYVEANDHNELAVTQVDY